MKLLKRNKFIGWLLGISLFVSYCQVESDKKNSKPREREPQLKKENHLYTNALINEKSPYLLQHAHNPVDWFPWGDEAFTKAKKEGKLIFLSIGYSTCHWCHVMEKESFEDKAVADLLKKDFIAIKVDREERPDVDNLYMGLAQAIGAGGGWPLNLFLTPERVPFSGGTYFPPEERYGRKSFKSVIQTIAEVWRSNPEKITQFTADIKEKLINTQAASPSDFDNNKILQQAVVEMQQQYEPVFGGFSVAPKFPMPHNLSFLLRDYYNHQNQKSLEMVTHTLDNMAAGGIYDQLGGGFHRYSTDKEWLAPHFEKMLYDQALLMKAYLEAYQVTKNPRYAEIVRECILYLKRDMLDAQGGFYSAEDADSEGEEGLFYVWTLEELREAIGEKHLGLVADWFGLSPQGNFEGKNILTRKMDVKEFARQQNISVSKWEAILKDVMNTMLAYRSQRIRPHLDDKIMVDWNGLMISALSMAAQILPEDKKSTLSKGECLVLAKGAADFVMTHLTNQQGRLIKSYRGGATKHLGFIEDYAFYTVGLIDLYEATFEVKYLQEAIRLAKDMKKYFWDDKTGGFYFVAHDQEGLLKNPKEVYDGAIPSGNSMAALAYARLAKFTGDKYYSETLDSLYRAFGGELSKRPSGYPQMLQAIDFSFNKGQEFVIAAKSQDQEAKEFLEIIHSEFLPRKVVILNKGDDPQKTLYEVVPFVESQGQKEGKPTFYLCENFACKQPTNDVNVARELVTALAPNGR